MAIRPDQVHVRNRKALQHDRNPLGPTNGNVHVTIGSHSVDARLDPPAKREDSRRAGRTLAIHDTVTDAASRHRTGRRKEKYGVSMPNAVEWTRWAIEIAFEPPVCSIKLMVPSAVAICNVFFRQQGNATVCWWRKDRREDAPQRRDRVGGVL
jgi:hypothetical protein